MTAGLASNIVGAMNQKFFSQLLALAVFFPVGTTFCLIGQSAVESTSEQRTAEQANGADPALSQPQQATTSTAPAQSATTMETPAAGGQTSQKSDDALRVESYKSQRVQRLLRTAQKSFEKLALEITKAVEKDPTYQNLFTAGDNPPTQQQIYRAHREAVERAMQKPQIKKLKSRAQKDFVEFRKAYNSTLDAKRASP